MNQKQNAPKLMDKMRAKMEKQAHKTGAIPIRRTRVMAQKIRHKDEVEKKA